MGDLEEVPPRWVQSITGLITALVSAALIALTMWVLPLLLAAWWGIATDSGVLYAMIVAGMLIGLVLSYPLSAKVRAWLDRSAIAALRRFRPGRPATYQPKPPSVPVVVSVPEIDDPGLLARLERIGQVKRRLRRVEGAAAFALMLCGIWVGAETWFSESDEAGTASVAVFCVVAGVLIAVALYERVAVTHRAEMIWNEHLASTLVAAGVDLRLARRRAVLLRWRDRFLVVFFLCIPIVLVNALFLEPFVVQHVVDSQLVSFILVWLPLICFWPACCVGFFLHWRLERTDRVIAHRDDQT
jgi:hypothetical protein